MEIDPLSGCFHCFEQNNPVDYKTQDSSLTPDPVSVHPVQ